jgi:argonaute-like protein implicated in RNA metabolism and viral defense
LHKEIISKGKDQETKDAQEDTAVEKRISILESFIQKALANYERNNKKLPEKIVVYRDGVGGPSMQQKVLSKELGKMSDAIKAHKPGYNPKILYVFVNKEINTRFFEMQKDGITVLNPPAGTVVDSNLVELAEQAEQFDFYMIPHTASIATARPVHYIVAKNDCKFTKRAIEEFTYAMCYNYFNFGGSIKVPASVMYAHKVANYCYDLGIDPNDTLKNNLHYL